MPNQEYWEKRELERATRLYDKYDNSYAGLKGLYIGANDDINKEISAFYNKYGTKVSSPTFKVLNVGTKVVVGATVKNVVTYTEAMKYDRLAKLDKQLNAILKDMASSQNSFMTQTLRELAEESYYTLQFQTYKGYGVGLTTKLLDPKVITQIINNPVHGQNFSTRVWNNKALLANQVNQTLNNGIIQGLSIRDMSKELAANMTSGYKVAERLIRTEITNTYNQASLQGYKDSGLVAKYQFLATLDSRTSDVCASLDNETFFVDKAVVGLNYPPMHVNCRSTTIAKFDDTVFERRARDEKGNTYTIPSNMNYAQWKAEYVD